MLDWGLDLGFFGESRLKIYLVVLLGLSRKSRLGFKQFAMRDDK